HRRRAAARPAGDGAHALAVDRPQPSGRGRRLVRAHPADAEPRLSPAGAVRAGAHLHRDLLPRAVLEPVLAVAGVARAAAETLIEQLTRAPFWKRDRTLLAIVGLLLIAGTGVFAWSDR